MVFSELKETGEVKYFDLKVIKILLLDAVTIGDDNTQGG